MNEYVNFLNLISHWREQNGFGATHNPRINPAPEDYKRHAESERRKKLFQALAEHILSSMEEAGTVHRMFWADIGFPDEWTADSFVEFMHAAESEKSDAIISWDKIPVLAGKMYQNIFRRATDTEVAELIQMIRTAIEEYRDPRWEFVEYMYA